MRFVLGIVLVALAAAPVEADATFDLDLNDNTYSYVILTTDSAKIQVYADIQGSLMSGSDSAGQFEEGSELAPVHRAHEMYKKVAAEELSDYQEGKPAVFKGSGLGEGRISLFKASSGLFGSKLKECYEACEKAMLSGDNDLVTFIGHNVLMDVDIPAPAEKAEGKTDAIVLCCISDRYFRTRLEDVGVRPVVLTTQLMYPGSFILHDALEPWMQGKARGSLRDAAGLAYAKNQKLKPAAAK